MKLIRMLQVIRNNSIILNSSNRIAYTIRQKILRRGLSNGTYRITSNGNYRIISG